MNNLIKNVFNLINSLWLVFREYCDPAFEGDPYLVQTKITKNNKKISFRFFQKQLGWKIN